MKVGEIYEVRHKWMLPHSQNSFWQNVSTVLYLGEDIITRPDGYSVVNHVVLANGEKRLLDQNFLKFFEEIDEDR
ncbi:MAG: hypothetical protein CBC29_06330 [Methylococcaceae bacterium TMED69]|mgnify:FL=1|nr:MAG: hypothetical protein CBC29_06330 [Methylococcaceae bacterium TMED69]|tara:strand:+ start:1390 stop:1614 length:225 start_codon:yes stop_codon:yes gene_type:complete